MTLPETIEQDPVSSGQGTTFSEPATDLPVGKMIAPDYYPGRPLPFAGQNHSYSVVLRGNGEAIFTLKAALTNSRENGGNLSRTTLRLPMRINPSEIAVYQIIAQGYCTRYDERPYYPPEISYRPSYTPRCIEFSEPDYFNYYGGGKYLRAKHEYNGDSLTVILPKPIAPEKSGAYFVHFRSMGYAKRTLTGAFKYDFESFKADDSINQMNIGFSTDSDLFLKGSKGSVEYRDMDSSAMMLKESAVGGAAPQASSAIDRVISQVGQGTIVKTASNLAAHESYKVSGMYADANWKLFGREVFTTVIFVLILALVILIVVRKILRAMNPPAVTIKKQVADVQRQENARSFSIVLGVSFASSVVFAGYTFVLMFLMNYLNMNYFDYRLSGFLAMATIVFSFCIYSVLLFVPGLFVGMKRGLLWGIVTVVLTVAWLFVYFIIVVAYIFMFGYQQSSISPVLPLMDSYRK